MYLGSIAGQGWVLTIITNMVYPPKGITKQN